ncbi:unnamed protein product [Symbiodinium sp. CCMP2592]|nr:unnamed protein product [Symbiodinium sp. CCMP2592]
MDVVTSPEAPLFLRASLLSDSLTFRMAAEQTRHLWLCDAIQQLVDNRCCRALSFDACCQTEVQQPTWPALTTVCPRLCPLHERRVNQGHAPKDVLLRRCLAARLAHAPQMSIRSRLALILHLFS